MRQQTITISANPADVQQEAERIANILRQQGNTVTATGVYTIQTGHKRGLPAVDLTIEEPVVEVAAAPEVTEVVTASVVDVTTTQTPQSFTVPSENDPESWRETSPEPAAEPPVKNKGGRPKGSKTRAKEAATA